MAEDYNYLRESSSLSEVEVKSELLMSNDDSVSQVEMKLVEENVVIKQEDNNMFISDPDYEGEGGEQCHEKEDIFPDLMEPNNDPLSAMSLVESCNSDTSAVHLNPIISSSEVIKNEQDIVHDNFHDESEREDEQDDNNYDDSNDPIDNLEYLDSNNCQAASVPIMESINDSSMPTFSCPNCDKTYTRKCYFDEHIISHKYEKDRTFTCPFCDQQFHFENNMKLHIKLVHKEALPPPSPKKPANDKVAYLCTLCKAVFQLPKQLQSHIQAVHLDEMPFKCAICDVHFKTKCGRTNHIKLCHLNKLPLPEDSSNEQSANKTSTTSSSSGVPSSSSSMLHTCEICFMQFNLKKSLLKHRRITHSIQSVVTVQYKCEKCGKQFWKWTAYDKHMRKHGGSKRKKMSASQKNKKKRELRKKTAEIKANKTIKVKAELNDCN